MADRRSYRIRFQAPVLPDADAIERYFCRSRETRWFSNGGPCHELLSARLSADLGGDVTVVPVNNATSGLMVAIRALSGRATDRPYVVVPSYTFVASASAIMWAGYEPIFVDVDPDSWHMNVASAQRAIEQHGSGIALVMACSTFGTPQSDDRLRPLRELARSVDAPLLVDSAAGYGSATPDGRRRPCDGDADVYSFHATKPFAIGEGGAIVATDPSVGNRLAALVNFGFDVRHLVGDEIGLNAKLDEWHCATALAVLDGYPEVLANRQAASHRVKSELADYGYDRQAGSELSASQFIAVSAPSEAIRDTCIRLARERGIELRDYYRHPLHTMPTLRRFATADSLPVTADLASRCLSLPLANDMTDSELDEVIDVCRTANRVSAV